ncbi:amino acid ABC transporter permease [Bosea sp. RCC_152_1]|uniref:amino acid ABC transporter permease n=1 Tax=Bosea sp. RCC_152_1 TaxID=3239228 RepID=UPI0035232A5D
MTRPSLPSAAAGFRGLPDLIARLTGTRGNLLITLALLTSAAWLLPPLVRWSLIDAVWRGDAATCASAAGACWAFIGEKLRFIVFGFYPQPLQWRASLAVVLVALLVTATAWPSLWGRRLLAVWLVAIPGIPAVLLGWPAGDVVPTEKWGGLPVTLLLAVGAFAGAFPLAILLALGRRSRMGGIRLLSIVFIELLRGVPFIAVLYAATLLFPLMLPAGSDVDKFLRAQIALVLFVAAYLAEIIRGGLQAIPVGQYEAAKALGLSYWRSMRLVVLPQAFRLVIPPLVNLAIGVFQDTTLVIIIGMFDFLNTSRVSATDPHWLGFYTEAYVFAALIYFLVCFGASRYSLWLEGRVADAGLAKPNERQIPADR